MGIKKTKTCNLPEPGDTNDNVDMKSEEGYGVIFDTYYPRILKYVNTRVKSLEDAEDITDVVFLKGWEKRSSYRGTGSPIAWLGKIAYNATNEYWRQEKRIEHQSYEDLEMQGDQRIRTYIRDGVLPPDGELETAETQRLLREAVSRLPQKYRDVIEAIYYLDLSGKETAEVLELSAEAVRARKHRALKMLRNMMT